jgi:hypothetical protein
MVAPNLILYWRSLPPSHPESLRMCRRVLAFMDAEQREKYVEKFGRPKEDALVERKRQHRDELKALRRR